MGSSDNVMVTAWEGSHLHFLKDWLPVGEEPEPQAGAKWFPHRTPLSHTAPSFNLPLSKQNNENFPSQVLALRPARVFPHRKQAAWSVCSACLLAAAHCLLSPQAIANLPLRDSVRQAWAMGSSWMWSVASYQLWGGGIIVIIIN